MKKMVFLNISGTIFQDRIFLEKKIVFSRSITTVVPDHFAPTLYREYSEVIKTVPFFQNVSRCLLC